jgi:DNA-binding CsgD family transcriptional regulator
MAGNKNSGRRAYVPTDAEREKVRVLKAGGMSNEAIATAIGISEPTLTKHFSSDIEVGAAKVTAEILMARYNSAKAGNVAAQNRLLELVGAVRAQEKRAPAVRKMGKKEERQLAAEKAAQRFAVREPPKLVVDNR